MDLSIQEAINEIKKFSDYPYLLDMAKDTFIVAFDDIGSEYIKKGSNWAVDEFAKIINHRYNHNKITLFTSNLTLSELAERLGTRTMDRLKEMCKIYLMEGTSLRTHKAKN